LCKDVVEAVPGVKGCERLALLVRPFDREVPTKPGAFDDTIVLANADVLLDDALRRLRRGKKEESPLFGVTLEEARDAFAQAAEMMGLGNLGLCLYQARHGGASRDALLRRRDLEGIKRRGRWSTTSSVRRYEKHGRMQLALSRTPNDVMEFCLKATARVQDIVDNKKVELRLPREA